MYFHYTVETMNAAAAAYRTIEESYDENDLMVALALLYVDDDWLLQHLFPMAARHGGGGCRGTGSHNRLRALFIVRDGSEGKYY